MPNRQARRKKKDKKNRTPQNNFGMSVGEERKFLMSLSKSKRKEYLRLKKGKTLQQEMSEELSKS